MPVAKGSNTNTTNIDGNEVVEVNQAAANIYKNVVHTVTTKDETTIITYTVPTGKVFDIVFFEVNSDSPLGTDIRIKIDSTVKYKLYIDNGNDLTDNVVPFSAVNFATAGEVVTVTSEALIKKGEVSAVLTGIERDA